MCNGVVLRVWGLRGVKLTTMNVIYEGKINNQKFADAISLTFVVF